MPDMISQRRVMVDNQIRTFDVTDRDVLAAFDRVPRELFVPDGLRPLAYSDRRLDLPGSTGMRSMLPPLLLARLIQALQPQAGETALDCFGGWGYSAAILATMGLEVTAIETDPLLVGQARSALAAAGAAAKVLEAQPGLLADRGPTGVPGRFDVILINGASEREPSGFFPLLKEGGRLGILRHAGSAARAEIYLRSGEIVAPRPAFDAQAPILPGFASEPAFIF